MFETLSHFALQQYWWIIISLLGAILVFMMFVQGGQTLLFSLGKTDKEKTLLINVLGSKWGLTFTTLVTFGGAFFASFPLFYSTSFGGAYWVWMIILLAFVLQAFGYEFHKKPNNLFGDRTYEIFLFINGLVGTVLIGTAVATFFTGSPFSINSLFQSQWETPWHGLELALNVHNLTLGLTVFFLARTLGLLYFLLTVDNTDIEKRIHKQLYYNAIPFVVFFLTFVIWLFIRCGFAVNPETSEVFMMQHKYLINLLEMPLILVFFLVGVLLVLFGIATSLLKINDKGIWFSASGTILTVFSLFIIAGFNNTSYYPSYFDLQSSLTIMNSSSSHFTLKVMSYASLTVPFVIAYIWYAWRALTRGKMSL